MQRHSLLIACCVAAFFQTIIATLRADIKTDIATLSGVLYNLDTRYVDTVNVDQLTEVAIKAVLKELDPHTTYMSPSEVRQFREGLDGGFEGIGVSFRMVHDTIVVIHPVAGGPSERVGIEAGDLIISCNDSILAGRKLTNDDIKQQLRGPQGSIAHLGIQRGNERKLRYFDVQRGQIPVHSVQTSYMATPTVGYIYVDRFGLTTANEVATAIKELTAQGMKDLVLDLQDNGGGYLNAAVDMASLFLPPLSLVVYTEGRSDDRRQYSTNFFNAQFKGRLVVIIDEQSASASEILAGAIQDYDRGVIVGRRSFGKGLVQRPVDLPNGGLMRMTVSHYYTPSGRCIQKPYVNGNQKDYHEDLLNRLHNGELVSADSIHLADSLKYFTKAGRTVYGGGGIMPDAFVPLDTTRMAPAHRAILASSSMLDYTLQYFRIHHTELHRRYPTLSDFDHPETGFTLTDDIVDGVIQQARRDSVKADDLDSLYTNDLFRTQIRAYIANNLYDNGAYKHIINATSWPYLRSLEILADERRYQSLLKGNAD